MIKILFWQVGWHHQRPFIEKALTEKNLIGAEIGIWHGENTRNLFKSGKVRRLYAIDPFVNYEEYEEKLFNNLENNGLIAKNKLKGYNIIWIDDFSSRAIKKIKEKVDFVYIDGNHNYSFVQEDIKNYWKIIKRGGVLGGHDFCYEGLKKDYGVIQAVTEFSVKNKLKLYIESPDWWIKKK